MAYTVQSTEKVRGKGADYETKAMLYLMSCRDDSHEIFSFAIDFFNDVTGLNSFADKAWDVQSKGTKGGSAKTIGRELVTLFKNYMSDLQFDHLILFMAEVPDTFRMDTSLMTFGIENIKPKALKSVKDGLADEASKKEYIDPRWVTEENIASFLSQVNFVIDDKSKAEYIKKIITINPKFIQNDEVLEGIFKNIRNKQSELKNENVEGEVINSLSEVYAYNRVLKSKNIRLMALNTIVNRDVIKYGIPVYFIPVIKNQDPQTMKDTVEDCQLRLAALLFDQTFAEEFWDLLDLICKIIEENPKLSTKKTFELIKDNPVVYNPRLDILTVQYLISVMKEALL